MVNDTVGDFLTRIRNAYLRGKDSLSLPTSKLNEKISEILKQENMILDYSIEESDIASHKTLTLKLKYIEDKPRIMGLKRISKPGVRVYVGYKDIPKVKGGLGLCVLTTSKGIMTGDKAKNEKIGGELICEIW